MIELLMQAARLLVYTDFPVLSIAFFADYESLFSRTMNHTLAPCDLYTKFAPNLHNIMKYDSI